MPKKTNFEKDLISQMIRRKDYQKIKGLRHGSEPFYSTLRRILDHSHVKKEDIEEEMKLTVEQLFAWKKRAEIAEGKLAKKKNGTLD